jgi:hypothetical protein
MLSPLLDEFSFTDRRTSTWSYNIINKSNISSAKATYHQQEQQQKYAQILRYKGIQPVILE